VEVYRGLLVDPKEARRLRYRKQQPRKPLANRRSPA
jgi:putative ubiquitin-RnfH superfamily antitoxin RatB of RatAB toxin-antitoxin module